MQLWEILLLIVKRTNYFCTFRNRCHWIKWTLLTIAYPPLPQNASSNGQFKKIKLWAIAYRQPLTAVKNVLRKIQIILLYRLWEDYMTYKRNKIITCSNLSPVTAHDWNSLIKSTILLPSLKTHIIFLFWRNRGFFGHLWISSDCDLG